MCHCQTSEIKAGTVGDCGRTVPAPMKPISATTALNKIFTTPYEVKGVPKWDGIKQAAEELNGGKAVSPKTVASKPTASAESISAVTATKGVFTTPYEVKELPKWSELRKTAMAAADKEPESTTKPQKASTPVKRCDFLQQVFMGPFEVKELPKWSKIQSAAADVKYCCSPARR